MKRRPPSAPQPVPSRRPRLATVERKRRAHQAPDGEPVAKRTLVAADEFAQRAGAQISTACAMRAGIELTRSGVVLRSGVGHEPVTMRVAAHFDDRNGSGTVVASIVGRRDELFRFTFLPHRHTCADLVTLLRRHMAQVA